MQNIPSVQIKNVDSASNRPSLMSVSFSCRGNGKSGEVTSTFAFASPGGAPEVWSKEIVSRRKTTGGVSGLEHLPNAITGNFAPTSVQQKSFKTQWNFCVVLIHRQWWQIGWPCVWRMGFTHQVFVLYFNFSHLRGHTRASAYGEGVGMLDLIQTKALNKTGT